MSSVTLEWCYKPQENVYRVLDLSKVNLLPLCMHKISKISISVGSLPCSEENINLHFQEEQNVFGSNLKENTWSFELFRWMQGLSSAN